MPRSRLGGEAGPADAEVSGDSLSVALEARERLSPPLRVPRCSPSIRCRRGPLASCTSRDRHPLCATTSTRLGTLTTLEGADAHRAYYQAFFDKYEVLSVDVLSQVAEDWYVFVELRVQSSVFTRPV